MATTRYLTADEQLVLEVRRHVAVLLGPAIPVMLALILGLVITPANPDPLLGWILWLPFLFFLARLAWEAGEWWIDRVVVTDKRIFEASGILVHNVATMPLSRVTDLTYRQTVLGRLFRYGEVVLESAGQDQALSSVKYLPNPDEFYRTLTRLALRKA